MKKRTCILMTALLLPCLLTACAADQNSSMMNTTAPTAMQTTEAPMTLPGTDGNDALLPIGTDAPGNLPNTLPETSGVTTITNARKAMEQIEDELERLSEVTDAQVVVAGSTAAVALRFDKQYKTGIDSRLQRMVEERIKGVVNGVTNVEITTDETIFEALEALGDRMESASLLTEIQTDLETIIARMRQTA